MVEVYYFFFFVFLEDFTACFALAFTGAGFAVSAPGNPFIFLYKSVIISSCFFMSQNWRLMRAFSEQMNFLTECDSFFIILYIFTVIIIVQNKKHIFYMSFVL